MKGPKKRSGNNPLRIAQDNEAGEEAFLTDNEALIRLMLKEDPEKGFSVLFKRYYGTLCSHVTRFVYSKEVAEDIVSEVFFHFWKNRLYATVTTSFRAYLYTAARNRAFNYLKQEFGEKLSADADWPVDNNPQTILLFNELMTKIERTIGSFPPQCQKVFLLSRFEGRKNREIADELNIRMKTVEAHIMKALGILRKTLSDYLKQ
ncbi:RNA polymerase sigma-70 factor [Dinghuibacter silviterrae]|uniref:RNA polymerase sigma-70 factor (ECF subfamily) n=1 Tax=Dinghuibacter silviterrae TaxID=1539049 RepID=A0A4R8DIT0_9BACT|nr:RNA polymerase sigma-70 factor [Dinghuibacter silviterrae]TDW97485.1 RNA polymerase sigma-70 factor (ECF subfamily) [Dinghuibacter silviterrae]